VHASDFAHAFRAEWTRAVKERDASATLTGGVGRADCLTVPNVPAGIW